MICKKCGCTMPDNFTRCRRCGAMVKGGVIAVNNSGGGVSGSKAILKEFAIFIISVLVSIIISIICLSFYYDDVLSNVFLNSEARSGFEFVIIMAVSHVVFSAVVLLAFVPLISAIIRLGSVSNVAYRYSYIIIMLASSLWFEEVVVNVAKLIMYGVIGLILVAGIIFWIYIFTKSKQAHRY